MAGDDDWVTWPQAAAIVGCPVPTIDWYTRLGRIEKRPFRGRRPTLKRTSVVEFAGWWRDRQATRQVRRQERRAAEARRRRDPQPPSPTGWISTRDVADTLRVTESHVAWLIGRGHLEGQRYDRRWWVRSGSVEMLARHREKERRWVSAAQAARTVGCSPNAILRAAHRGVIEQRRVDHQRPSLSRGSVEQFRHTWAARAQAQAAQRQARQQARQQAEQWPASSPPDDLHDWLTTREVAALFGLSPSRVNQLARSEQLPATAQGWAPLVPGRPHSAGAERTRRGAAAGRQRVSRLSRCRVGRQVNAGLGAGGWMS